MTPPCWASATTTPELGLEVLCTKGGDGALSVGDAPLLVKGAKPLPSSD